MPEPKTYSEQETIDALLDLLPIVADREWEVRENGNIRMPSGFGATNMCPLCALANEVQGYEQWYLSAATATRLVIEPGTSIDAASRLMDAADFKTDEPALRYRMMLALGLTPDVEAPTDAPA
jgi:hypothetical protein